MRKGTRRVIKQLRISDLERLPDPAIDAAELSPQDVIGIGQWNAYGEAQQRQLGNELDEWLSGMYRARANAGKTIARGDAHELPAFRKLRQKWIDPLASALMLEREAVAGRSRRGRLPTWFRLCADIPEETLATVTLEVIFSSTASMRSSSDKTVGALLTQVAVRIGHTLEWMLKLDAWMQLNPKLYNSYRKRLAAAGATRGHKDKVLLHGYNNKFLPSLKPEASDELPDRWDTPTSVAIGTGLILAASASTGGRIKLIDYPGDMRDPSKPQGRKRRPKKPRKLVALDDETLKWCAEALRNHELKDRRLRAMVCPPIPWRGPRGGGYLIGNGTVGRILHEENSSGRRVYAMLREAPEKANQVYSALNYLGRTAWRVRRNVLDVALEARESRLVLPDLPVEGRRVPLPVKPPDIATNEDARKLYRYQRARAEEANYKERSREMSSEFALQEADLMRDEPELYFPHRCDFRGRMYPMAHGLHVQGSDLRRALLEFAHGKPVTQDDSSAGWLAAYVAKLYGHGKLSFDERIAWTFDNEPLIRRIAEDPLSNRQEWEGSADRKHLWQCLAASREWIAYLEEGDGFVSHLPIYVDGTCNAIQHFAALARDSELAGLVNLSASERPQDIYIVIAERAYKHVRTVAEMRDSDNALYARMLLEMTGGNPDRGFAKKAVMTHPYGGTLHSVMEGVRDRLRELDPEHSIVPADDSPKFVGFTAKELKDALMGQLAKPEAALEWLRQCVEIVARLGVEAGAAGTTWVTPSGWPWALVYGITYSTKRDVWAAGGRAQVRLTLQDDRNVDIKKQKSAASPNFVHALDATALVFALNTLKREKSVSGVAAIHDSVGALAVDMPAVSDAVREGFVKLYTEHDPLMSFYESVVAQTREQSQHEVPYPPEPGDFDVREVLSSPYFFS